MTVQTYNPGDVVVTFGGYVLENWDSVEVTRLAPAFKMVRGIRGGAARVRTLNTSAEVIITLPMTSRANAILSMITQQDYETGNGRLEMTIKDVSGFEVFSTVDAFVEKQANMTYGREMPSRSWTICCMTSVISQSSGSAGIESIFDL